MIKLAILASGNGSNMVAIAEAIKTGYLDASIEVVIYNNPEAKVAEKALYYNISTKLIDHRNYLSKKEFNEDIKAALDIYQPDLVILAGWMRVLSPVVLDAYPSRILNIHPSLLPSFPGLNAVQQALDHGVKVTGCTVHYVVPEVDAGPIILQSSLRVLEKDNLDSLTARIQYEEHLHYSIAIRMATKNLCRLKN